MKQKFHPDIVLLGIVAIISLVSVLGVHSFEASATLNTVNSQTGPDINIVRQLGNTTVTNSTNTVKIGIGPNVIVINKNQTYTAGAKQTFGPSTTSAGINLGVLTNNPTSVKQGDLWYQSTINVLGYGGVGGQPLQLVTTGTPTQTIAGKRFVDSSTSFISGDLTRQVLFSVANIASGHIDTWTFPNANSTFVGTGVTQTITSPTTMNSLILGGQMNLAGNTLQSSGHVYTFPSNTGTVLMTNGTLTGTVSGATLSGTLAGTPTYSGLATFNDQITANNGITITGSGLNVNSGGITSTGLISSTGDISSTGTITASKDLNVNGKINAGTTYLGDTHVAQAHKLTLDGNTNSTYLLWNSNTLSMVTASNNPINFSPGGNLALKLSSTSPFVQFQEGTTGSGTASLGTLNSPAVTLGAPHNWIKVTCTDGGTCYIPEWK